MRPPAPSHPQLLHWQGRLAACGLIAALSLGAGELAARHESRQIIRESGAQALQQAQDMADRLSQEVSARSQDLLRLSQQDDVRGAVGGDAPGALRPVLEQFKAALAHSEWIVLANARGVVVEATSEEWAGTSIARHSAFRHGSRGPWSSEAQDLPQAHTAGSVRAFDLAVPVHDAGGAVKGVLAMRMGWQWIEESRRARATSATTHLSVMSADGRGLLGPAGVASAPALRAHEIDALEGRAALARWSDGQEAVTGVAPSRVQGSAPGPGWRVVVRDTHAAARASLTRTREGTLPWSLGIGALGMLLAWWGMGRLRPSSALLGVEIQPRDPAAPRRADTALRQRRTDQPHARQQIVSLKPKGETMQALESNARIDPLTGLYNRAYLDDAAERLVAARAEDGPHPVEFCILHVGLDGFRSISDRYGRDAADHVLAQVGKRLRNAARAGDLAFRLGDDDFMLLLACPAGEGLALSKAVAQRVISDLKRPVAYRTLSNLQVDCSAGAAVWPLHAAALQEAVRRAEEALCAARTGGGAGRFRLYAPQDDWAGSEVQAAQAS